MPGMWAQDFGQGWNDLRGKSQVAGLVVPGNLVADESKEWSQRLGVEEDSRAGQLRDSLDMAA